MIRHRKKRFGTGVEPLAKLMERERRIRALEKQMKEIFVKLGLRK